MIIRVAVGLCVLLPGCQSEYADRFGFDASAPPSDPGASEVSPLGPVSVAPGSTDSGPPPPMIMAVDTLGFTRPFEDGTVPGFNLDGRVSDSTDEATCGKPDFVSPDGEEGIDNQLAVLTPLFDLVGIGAVEDLVQGAIDEGGLLILFEIQGLDDVRNDDSITLRMRLGQGTPLLGTDGLVLSGQTFDLHAESPDLVLENAVVIDGVLTAGPTDAVLPIVVFGVLYQLEVKGARVRAELTYDGGMTNAIMAGGVPIANLLEIAAVAEMEAGGIIDAVTALVSGIGDLEKDENGVCQQMSATLSITAVSAFLQEEAQ